MNTLPNPKLVDLLMQAYRPCANFGLCREAVWDPVRGHIPRGFLGATGDLSNVELIMLFAEPGFPHKDESYDPNAAPEELMRAALEHAYSCFSTGLDLFHRNARWFTAQLFPDLTFDEVLCRVWMTEGRLCSISDEIGSTKDRTCAASYLTQQIDLMPNATVVAFGGKAKHYMKGMNTDWLSAYALAPPGANHLPAKPSWEAAIAEIKNRRTV